MINIPVTNDSAFRGNITQNTTKEICMDLGASGFLTKPVVKEERLDKISEFVHGGLYNEH